MDESLVPSGKREAGEKESERQRKQRREEEGSDGEFVDDLFKGEIGNNDSSQQFDRQLERSRRNVFLNRRIRDQTEREISELRRTKKILDDANARLASEKEALSERFRQRNDEFRMASEEVDSKEKQLNEKMEELRQLRMEMERIRNDKSQNKSAIEDAQRLKDIVDAQLKRQTAALNEINKEMEDLSESFSDMLSTANDRQAHIDYVSDLLDQMTDVEMKGVTKDQIMKKLKASKGNVEPKKFSRELEKLLEQDDTEAQVNKFLKAYLK